MNNKFVLISVSFFVLIVLFSFNVQSSCVIQGYAKDNSGTLVGYSVNAYCQNDNSWRNITGTAGDQYGVSWGGPADSCQSFCNNVYVNGSNSTLGIYGFPNGYFPLNSGNEAGWSSGSAHNINITMKEWNNPTAFFGTFQVDGINTTSTTLLFEGSCWDDVGLNKMVIYGSWGGWGIKGSKISPSNDTVYGINIGPISEGTWKWAVYCEDTSGNIDFTDTNRTFTIDLTGPTITINSPIANHYYNTDSIGYDVTTDEAAAGCQFSKDGLPPVTMTPLPPIPSTHFIYNETGISQGLHTWEVWCTDLLGNPGNTGPITFYVDLTKPLASFGTNPIDGSTQTSTTITFDAKCSDNMALNSLQVWTNKTGTWAVTITQASPTNDTIYNLPNSGWTDGDYIWAVYCEDEAGWIDWTNTNRTFNVNTNVYTLNILSPSSTAYYVSSIWFNTSTNKVSDWCGYSLDGTGNISMDTFDYTTWTKLNDSMTTGSHSVEVTCNSTLGEWASDSKSFSITSITPGTSSGSFGFIILGLFLFIIFLFWLGFNSKSIPVAVFTILLGCIFLIFLFNLVMLNPEIQSQTGVYSIWVVGYQGIVYLVMLVVFVLIIFLVFQIVKWQNYNKKSKMRRWGLTLDDE